MKAIYSDGKLFLYAGVVDKDVRYFSKEGANCACVTLRDRNEDIIDIYFKDKDNKKMAEHIKKANVAKGAYISVFTVGKKDAKTATGLDFKYSGIWTFKGKEGKKDTTVIHGTVCNLKEPGDGIFAVSVPVNTYSNGNTETVWYQITFYNSDNGKYHNADTAKKLLKDKTKCCIRGGEIRDKVVGNKTYHDITGFGIDMPPYSD